MQLTILEAKRSDQYKITKHKHTAYYTEFLQLSQQDKNGNLNISDAS